MCEATVVEGDDRPAERRRIAGFEGDAPLAALVVEADHDHVRPAKQRLRAHRIDAGTFVITPELALLLTEDARSDVVGGRMVGDRREHLDREPGGADSRHDRFAPVGVDLPGEIHAPGAVDSLAGHLAHPTADESARSESPGIRRPARWILTDFISISGLFGLPECRACGLAAGIESLR